MDFCPPTTPIAVTPAKAGVQLSPHTAAQSWIPAFAGMTAL